MLQQYHTKLKGTLALTDSYLTEKTLQKEKGLYKFIWVRNGSITVEIDHQEMTLTQDEVISLTHLQHLEFKSIDGEYLTLLFNSNFYCIYGNDHEVSCSGFQFNGSSHLIRFTLIQSLPTLSLSKCKTMVLICGFSSKNVERAMGILLSFISFFG